MSIVNRSRAVFENYEIDRKTEKLATAVAWIKEGFCVHTAFKDEDIQLIFGGTVDTKSDIPEDASFGVVFACKSSGEYYISLPAELSFPEVGFLACNKCGDGLMSEDIRQAAEWKKLGMLVYIIVDGENKGILVNGGSIKSAELRPKNADFGVMFYAEDDDVYFITV